MLCKLCESLGPGGCEPWMKDKDFPTSVERMFSEVPIL